MKVFIGCLSTTDSFLQSAQLRMTATACQPGCNSVNLTNNELKFELKFILIHELFEFLQVQKNCLLALCSDYILQDVPFDKLVYFLSRGLKSV